VAQLIEHRESPTVGVEAGGPRSASKPTSRDASMVERPGPMRVVNTRSVALLFGVARLCARSIATSELQFLWRLPTMATQERS